MKNTYTLLIMSSNQDLVRQFSIHRGLALCLGLVLCLSLFCIISFAALEIKRSLRYQIELQGEITSREQLENTIKQQQQKEQAVDKELRGLREMADTVRRVLGIGSGQGVLGQGGG